MSGYGPFRDPLASRFFLTDDDDRHRTEIGLPNFLNIRLQCRQLSPQQHQVGRKRLERVCCQRVSAVVAQARDALRSETPNGQIVDIKSPNVGVTANDEYASHDMPGL